MANPKQLGNLRISALHNSTRVALVVHGVDESGNFVSPGAGSTQVSVKEILTSSGASVMDSTEGAIKVNVVAGAAGGSTTITVRQSTAADLTAAVVQGSTVWQAQVSSLAGVVAVQQNSTVWAIQVDGRVRAQNSTIGDLLASVQQNSTVWQVQIPTSQSIQVKNSTIGDLLASVQQNSTNWVTQVSSVGGVVTVSTGPFAVSSIAGPVTVRSSAANALGTVYQSTASEMQVTARVNTSSGGAVEGSTTAPAVGTIGLHVRQVFPTMQSTTIVVTSTHSTAIYPIVSSVAGLRHKVYAYFVGSTHMNPSTLIFCSSISNSAFDHWAVNFGSGSSGITGANLAMTPPGFIFGGVSQNALNIKIEGGSSITATCVARVSISWFDEA